METSVSLGAFGNLTTTRLNNLYYGELVTQSEAPTAGVLGTFRQSFSPWLGYTVNASFTRANPRTQSAPTVGNVNNVSVYQTPANKYELSAAYVAQQRITPKLTSFFDVGAGLLTYLPERRGPFPVGTPYYAKPPVDFRPAGVGGVGFDFHLTPRWALRAEYRALLYKYPDFGVSGKSLTVSSQPAVSMTYTFGAGKKKTASRKFY